VTALPSFCGLFFFLIFFSSCILFPPLISGLSEHLVGAHLSKCLQYTQKLHQCSHLEHIFPVRYANINVGMTSEMRNPEIDVFLFRTFYHLFCVCVCML
jgi:hypothetical protein